MNIKKRSLFILFSLCLLILFSSLLETNLYHEKQKILKETTNYLFTIDEIEKTLPFEFEKKEVIVFNKSKINEYSLYNYKIKDKNIQLIYIIAKNKNDAFDIYEYFNNLDVISDKMNIYNATYGNVYYEIVFNKTAVAKKVYFKKIKNQLLSIEKQK